jgi:hypothetical protein
MHQIQVLYRNLDLDQIIDDCSRGKINGFKNFEVDGGLEVVQAAAGSICYSREMFFDFSVSLHVFVVEWVNCMQSALDVINYTLTNTDIGFTCTGYCLFALLNCC